MPGIDFGLTEILAIGSLAASAVGTISSVAGQAKQAAANAATQNFNAAVAKQNQQIALQQAQWTEQAGAQQVAAQGQKTRAAVGGLIAQEAASGVDVNTGSPVDVRSSAAATGQLDALTLKSNASQAAYGREVEAASASDTAALDTAAAQADRTAGILGATGSFFGGAGSALNNYLRMSASGLLNPNTEPNYNYTAGNFGGADVGGVGASPY